MSSGFFENDRVMFIPLSIDTSDTNKTGYFFSNKKIVYMAVALLPLLFLLYPMLQGGVKLLQIGIVIVMYAIFYSFFFRYVILEENRLRKDVRELDNNRYSNISYFWGITKITTKGDFSGIIHYEKEFGGRKELGIVVSFDRGSTVGVPVGNYRRFRHSKQEFLREIHLQGFNFRWYELPLRHDTPLTFINYFNYNKENKNVPMKKVIQLQLELANTFVKDSEELFTDYILITNHKISTMKNFRSIIQSIIESTLDSNDYIINPRILDKDELDSFFANVLVLDSLDSDIVRRGTENVPFENFAKINRIIDRDGKEVNIDFAEDIDVTSLSEYGESIEADLEKDQAKYESKLKDIERRRQLEKEKLTRGRIKDKMTNKDYIEETKQIDIRFDKELENLKELGWNYQFILRQEELKKEKALKSKDSRDLREKELLTEDEFINDDVDIEIHAKDDFVIKEYTDEELLEMRRAREEEENRFKGIDFDDDEDDDDDFGLILDDDGDDDDFGFIDESRTNPQPQQTVRDVPNSRPNSQNNSKGFGIDLEFEDDDDDDFGLMK